MSDTHPGPYGSAAWTMHRDGWHPLPVPHGRKDSPPAGFTGYAGGPREAGAGYVLSEHLEAIRRAQDDSEQVSA